MNDVVDRASGSTCCVSIDGVVLRNKTAKVGLIDGWRGHLRMIGQMREARRNLEESDGIGCAAR